MAVIHLYRCKACHYECDVRSNEECPQCPNWVPGLDGADVTGVVMPHEMRKVFQISGIKIN